MWKCLSFIYDICREWQTNCQGTAASKYIFYCRYEPYVDDRYKDFCKNQGKAEDVSTIHVSAVVLNKFLHHNFCAYYLKYTILACLFSLYLNNSHCKYGKAIGL